MEENVGWLVHAPTLRGTWLNSPSKEVTSDNSINAVIMEQANAINIVNQGKFSYRVELSLNRLSTKPHHQIRDTNRLNEIL